MERKLLVADFTFTSLLALLPALSLINADLYSDRQALLDFAYALPHLRRLNWSVAVPVCSSWLGITCNKEGTRVVAVHLPAVGLYGAIPANSIGRLDTLTVLSLRSNHLNGSLPPDILSIPSLQFLYLQHNNFSGGIPQALSPQLTVLDLSFNSFTGEIPSAFTNLWRLSVLNIQFNSFSGNISNLDLPRVKYLNLSHNILNRTIPESLQRFPTSSFIGNSYLCGSPLSNCSDMHPSPSPSSNFSLSPPEIPGSVAYTKKLNPGVIVAIVVGGSSVLILLVLIILLLCLKKKRRNGNGVVKTASQPGNSETSKDFGSGVQANEKNKLVFFEGCSFSFDLEDLLRASAEVLGKGSFGTTYKATLEEGKMFAVKRLREVDIGRKEFEQQMETVGKVGWHPNIAPLRAYYYSKDEKLLVYEYMPGSSLSATLHSSRDIGKTLDWDTRVRILLGAARGIAHIHASPVVKMIHGNIKSTNVLLTGDLDGCISEHGLIPLMTVYPPKQRGVGYLAPEVTETRKMNQKSDVYSFGVILLETLTGKSPLPAPGQEDVIDLARWVQSAVREEWTAEVFDAELLRYQHIEEEMVQMLQVALVCVTKLPDDRPTMDEVVRMIEEIRQPELDNRHSSDDNRSKDSNVHTP